jgi:amidase
VSWIGASAKEIARAVRRGDVSATQVLADHLDHIRSHDPRLSAFRAIREGEAAAEAEQVDQQEDLAAATLAGVPVAVKENTPVAGLPTWRGSAAARGRVAEADHEVVRRLRGAGAVVVGTTRMPELGLWGTTDDESAVTRNPWQLDRTPGGSSGGAAAAVAAGLVPIAHCNDGFGSIRVPAACCGLVGLKPGRGVVVPYRLGGDDWFGLAEHGVLATTVADAVAGFAVLAGQRPGALEEPARLRVAVSLRCPAQGVRADAANRSAVATAARLLLAAGHDALRGNPTYPTWLGLRGLATWSAAPYRDAEAAGLDRSTLQPRTRRHLALGEWAWRRGYVREADRDRWRERALAFFDSYDLLLTPALAGVPPPAESWSARPWRANLLANLRYAPYAAPWNVAGFPAIVVPVGTRPDGRVPVGVQLVGPPGSERLLLAVAGQFEQAAPWPRHAPLDAPTSSI